MVAYARVLQHWVEWNNLPTGGESHLLARSILELRKEVEWYLSFTDEAVFWGVVFPKEEEEDSPQTPSTANPEAHCMSEPVPEKKVPKFVGWEKVLQLS